MLLSRNYLPQFWTTYPQTAVSITGTHTLDDTTLTKTTRLDITEISSTVSGHHFHHPKGHQLAVINWHTFIALFYHHTLSNNSLPDFN